MNFIEIYPITILCSRGRLKTAPVVKRLPGAEVGGFAKTGWLSWTERSRAREGRTG